MTRTEKELWRQARVSKLVREHKILVKPQIRDQLRLLDFSAFHTTFVDEFGNFHALVTDGLIAWVKLADGKVITVHLENIQELKEDKQKEQPQTKTKKPRVSKKLISVLKTLLELGIELNHEQQQVLDLWKQKHTQQH